MCVGYLSTFVVCGYLITFVGDFGVPEYAVDESLTTTTTTTTTTNSPNQWMLRLLVQSHSRFNMF